MSCHVIMAALIFTLVAGVPGAKPTCASSYRRRSSQQWSWPCWLSAKSVDLFVEAASLLWCTLTSILLWAVLGDEEWLTGSSMDKSSSFTFVHCCCCSKPFCTLSLLLKTFLYIVAAAVAVSLTLSWTWLEVSSRSFSRLVWWVSSPSILSVFLLVSFGQFHPNSSNLIPRC